MTKRQKQRLIVLVIVVGISFFSYSKEYIVKEFPQLQTIFRIVPQTEKREVKGDTTIAKIVRIVDGDTIIVSFEGKEEKVRLIGVNTPESVDLPAGKAGPRRKVECFGKEATGYMKQLLSGKSVNLQVDVTQQDRDRYGRLLRYVFFADGRLVNQLIIQEGYAYEYTYDLPYQYQSEFKKAEDEAKASEKGLWGRGTCNGEK